MGNKFRFIDHTGDEGVEVYGKDLKALFVHAAEAFTAIVTDSETIDPKTSQRISLQAGCMEELLIGWLNELNFLFDTERLLFRKFTIESLEGSRLEATAEGETYDAGHHPINTTVKGATYHQLDIRKDKTGWTARIIFDL
ncbi:MAG: archease [Syntrophales bacterium]|jgi:SHS2 domain-containing protein|nr:archease [Syntrophales bacterium]